MTERTVLTKATSKSESLRTTVPRWIVKHFDLKERDRLEWKLEVHGSSLKIIVKPLKGEAPSNPGPPAARRQRTLATRLPPDLVAQEDVQQQGKRRWRLR